MIQSNYGFRIKIMVKRKATKSTCNFCISIFSLLQKKIVKSMQVNVIIFWTSCLLAAILFVSVSSFFLLHLPITLKTKVIWQFWKLPLCKNFSLFFLFFISNYSLCRMKIKVLLPTKIASYFFHSSCVPNIPRGS